MALRTPANKGHTYPVETLTSQELQALLQACSHRAPTGIRNRALLALLWRSGLRISEALMLYPRDLDPQQGSVRVRRGKGGKARLVGLDPQAFAMVQRWLDQRHGLGLTGRAPVFCTLAGKPLQTSYIRMLLPRLARRAGIDKRVHAHGLRHTHAAELAAERVPINQIQQQLGHASPRHHVPLFGSHCPTNPAGDAISLISLDFAQKGIYASYTLPFCRRVSQYISGTQPFFRLRPLWLQRFAKQI